MLEELKEIIEDDADSEESEDAGPAAKWELQRVFEESSTKRDRRQSEIEKENEIIKKNMANREPGYEIYATLRTRKYNEAEKLVHRNMDHFNLDVIIAWKADVFLFISIYQQTQVFTGEPTSAAKSLVRLFLRARVIKTWKNQLNLLQYASICCNINRYIAVHFLKNMHFAVDFLAESYWNL